MMIVVRTPRLLDKRCSYAVLQSLFEHVVLLTIVVRAGRLSMARNGSVDCLLRIHCKSELSAWIPPALYSYSSTILINSIKSCIKKKREEISWKLNKRIQVGTLLTMTHILTALTFGVVVGSALTFWISKVLLGHGGKGEPDKIFNNGLQPSFFLCIFLHGGGLGSKWFRVLTCSFVNQV
jgi:hypothetical protein